MFLRARRREARKRKYNRPSREQVEAMASGDDDGERMKKKVNEAIEEDRQKKAKASTGVPAPAPQPQPPAAADQDGFDMFSDSPTLAAAANPSATNPSGGASTSGAQPAATDTKLADNWDDAEGYYKTMPGDTLSRRYLVQSFLGQGVFASVVRASDVKGEFGTNLAVKVIRANDLMTRAAEKELALLKKVRRFGLGFGLLSHRNTFLPVPSPQIQPRPSSTS